MRKSTLNKLICLIAMLVLWSSCKSKKLVMAPEPTPVPEIVVVQAIAADNSKINKISQIKERDAVFSTLAIKAKADLSIDNKSNDVNMNIRMKNNEVVWVSVTAMAGVEVARAMITPDSVKILNRLDNIYIKKPFSYIYEFTNDKINFKTLQSVLIGNTVADLLSDSTELNAEGDDTLLKSILGTLVYDMRSNIQNKVTLNKLGDSLSGQELIVNYGNFISVNQRDFPHRVEMSTMTKKKSLGLKLEFLKVDVDGVIDLPFRVPDRFLIKN